MQQSNAQPARRILSFTHLEAAVRRFLVAYFRGSVVPERDSPCPGRAWTDSAEREFTDNIAACRFARR